MFKNLIVPIDGSDLSQKSLEKVKELAKADGAKVTLVYVSDPLSKTVSTVDLAEAKVTEKQELGFTPHKIVWVGIPAAHQAH